MKYRDRIQDNIEPKHNAEQKKEQFIEERQVKGDEESVTDTVPDKSLIHTKQ